jgi:hypothetical protein
MYGPLTIGIRLGLEPSLDESKAREPDCMHTVISTRRTAHESRRREHTRCEELLRVDLALS